MLNLSEKARVVGYCGNHEMGIACFTVVHGFMGELALGHYELIVCFT